MFLILLFFIFRVYKIGRNPEKSDIPVIDPTISRLHAQLEITEDSRFFLKDLKSGIEYF